MKKSKFDNIIYQADMKCLFAILLQRGKNVVEVHKLLGRMFNCIWYRRKLKEAETHEGRALARWSINDADNELDALMAAWCLSDDDRSLIRQLVKLSV